MCEYMTCVPTRPVTVPKQQALRYLSTAMSIDMSLRRIVFGGVRRPYAEVSTNLLRMSGLEDGGEFELQCA